MFSETRYQSVIIGGGISGLSASIRLAEAGKRVLLIESQNSLGGKIKSTNKLGVLTEEGPDELIIGYKKFDALLIRANIFNNLIHPETTNFYIFARNKFREFPQSLISGIPSFKLMDIYEVISSGILSPFGYLRAMMEPVIKINNLNGDISIKELFERKFGSEFTKNIIDPLFGGIMGADISIISAKSYIPYIYNVVKDGKSLSIFFSKRRGAGHFEITSTVNGLTGVIEGLKKYAEKIGVKITIGTAADSIEKSSDGWSINAGNNIIKCDRLVLAVPSYVASKLISNVDKGLSKLLLSIKYSSIAVVNFVLRESSIKIHDKYSGFLIPSISGLKLRGCTFMSRKWSYAKIKDHELIRCFIDINSLRSEEQLVQNGIEELHKLEVIDGFPEKYAAKVWNAALPIYMVGHSDLLKKINENTPPNLYLAGAPYNGVGVASSGVSGIEAAEKILSEPQH